MVKIMKVKDLIKYGIPSYILPTLENQYSSHLLPLQKIAVKNYGVLNCKVNNNLPQSADNLMIIAPTSSGKSFIGEIAAISRAIHLSKTIYLLPLKSPTEERYRHFKNLYSRHGFKTVLSTRNFREEDHRIIRGNYKIAFITYEKFNYFLLKYPNLLNDVSLLIIDEFQVINHLKWGPRLEDIITQLYKKDLIHLKIIALSALIENHRTLLKWFPFKSRTLLSYQYPVELRKGIVREGTFKYISSHKKNHCTCGKEIFFHPKSVRDNCFEDYFLETLKHFVSHNEPTLIFFPTCNETRHRTEWLSTHLNCPAASSALKKLEQMEETSSRDALLKTLEKGMAFYNQDLSWEEKYLLKTYIKTGEIKIICATTTLFMSLNIPFKNVIILPEKMYRDDENHLSNYQTGINFTDIENLGGRAGIFNLKNQQMSTLKNQKFGRVILLAYSRINETIYKNLYLEYLKNKNDITATKYFIKKEKDLLTYLLRFLFKYNFKTKKLLKSLIEDHLCSDYWHTILPKENIHEKLHDCLQTLTENHLIKERCNGHLSLTQRGILIVAKRIKVDTYFFLHNWIKESKKGAISHLEILYLLSQTPDGEEIPIPFYHPLISDCKKERHKCEQEEIHAERILSLLFQKNEQSKKIYYQNILLKNTKEDEIFSLQDQLSFKKTLLLYDWITGIKSLKTIEQEYNLYRGSIYRLAEGFSWLADSLATIAENSNWKKNRKQDLIKIKLLSNRLIEGVTKEGLELANLSIPGLSRYYIQRLLQLGYTNKQHLKDLSLADLSTILPDILAKRIKKYLSIDFPDTTITVSETPSLYPDSNSLQLINANFPPESYTSPLASCNLQPSPPFQREAVLRNAKYQRPNTILIIDLQHTDRIIFMGKEIKVTAKEFSIIHLLACHHGEVLSYETILIQIWGVKTEAIQTRIIQHISNLKKNILKAIGKRKTNQKMLKNIFKAVYGRGIQLKLNETEIQINQ